MLTIQTVGDDAYDTDARIIGALEGWHAEIVWAPDVVPYCPNPVAIVRLDSDGDLVVCETDNGSTLDHSTFAIPQAAIRTIRIL